MDDLRESDKMIKTYLSYSVTIKYFGCLVVPEISFVFSMISVRGLGILDCFDRLVDATTW